MSQPKKPYPKLDEAIRNGMRDELLASLVPDQDIWVFGYGSLMWRPDFDFIEQRRAHLVGWHRSFCVYSHRYRGTAENPGLVLGLDHGGECHGIAFQVAADQANDIMRYLWEREMVTGVYEPKVIKATADGQSIDCHCFVVDHQHPQYAGGLSTEDKLQMISSASGSAGENKDYLLNTADHLQNININDPYIEDLAEKLRQTRE